MSATVVPVVSRLTNDELLALMEQMTASLREVSIAYRDRLRERANARAPECDVLDLLGGPVEKTHPRLRRVK